MTYAISRFWGRVAQIRNSRDQLSNAHTAHVEAIERAVMEIVDDACSPWFDSSAFYAIMPDSLTERGKP